MANPEIRNGNSWAVIFPATPTSLDSRYPYPQLGVDAEGALWLMTSNVPDNAVWRRYHHKAGAKAWVNFTGATGNINSGFNVASVSRNSTGNYTIGFASPMSNANYVANATGEGTRVILSIESQTVNSLVVQAEQANALSVSSVDPTVVCVVVFGQQSLTG